MNMNFEALYQGGVSRNAWANLHSGIHYYVDVTNGSDAVTNNGLSWAQAFQTIDHALTIWAAATSGLGDVIWIAPGTYPEELTTDLTRVALIGVPGVYPGHIASIRPVDGCAYLGTMFEAMFKNIAFLSPSTATTLPAVQLTNARYSIIEDCHFCGRDPACIEGLQIGNTDAVATAANFDFCIVRRNRFDSWYGVASEFTHAIKVGRVGYDAGCAVKQMVGTAIEDNDVYALTYGIYIGTYCADFSVIRRNLVDSMAAENGCATAGIECYGGYPAIADNNVNATDAIIAPAAITNRVFNNCVTNAGTGPVMELPVRT